MQGAVGVRLVCPLFLIKDFQFAVKTGGTPPCAGNCSRGAGGDAPGLCPARPPLRPTDGIQGRQHRCGARPMPRGWRDHHFLPRSSNLRQKRWACRLTGGAVRRGRLVQPQPRTTGVRNPATAQGSARPAHGPLGAGGPRVGAAPTSSGRLPRRTAGICRCRRR